MPYDEKLVNDPKGGMPRLIEVMRALRDPDTGCPWDIAQDFASIAPYTIEEAYEVMDAIERRDMEALRDELGDLLLQVAFHSRMAEQAGHFSLQDVIDGITRKMIRRHPHVFGEGARREDGHAQWEAIKAAERAEGKSARLSRDLVEERGGHRRIAAIEAIASSASPDQLRIARLKRQKLRLRDDIAAIEDRIVPDIIA